LLGESAERKKDFSEISAYRNSITRRGNRRHAAKQRDEVAPPHSITSSAATSSGSATVRPSVLAVFMLKVDVCRLIANHLHLAFFERTDDSRLWGELPIANIQAGAGTNTFGVAVFVLHL